MHLGLAEVDEADPARIASLIRQYLDEKAEEDRHIREMEARSAR